MSNFLKIQNDNKEYKKVNAYEILFCFSEALDLVSPIVANHQLRVAYIAMNIAREYGLSKNRIDNLVVAACLHDIGAITVEERNDIVKINYESDGRHEKIGAAYLNKYPLFREASLIVRYHHRNYDFGKGKNDGLIKVPDEAFILHLADRIDTYIDKNSYIISQTDKIKEIVLNKKDSCFEPKTVEAFLKISNNESFWLYLISKDIEKVLFSMAKLPIVKLDLDELYDISSWFSDVIDFRSKFTSVHSKGVASSAKYIAKCIGLSKKDQKILEISGFLHDLGKLAIPNKILEKADKLNKHEFEIIRSHTFYTYIILDKVTGLEYINKYASYHHERLDGNGYPFHLKQRQLSFGSRILAVADIFTAIAEDRPYRLGMEKADVINVISSKGDNKCLDSNVVKVFIENYDYINEKRKEAQENELKKYQKLWKI